MLLFIHLNNHQVCVIYSQNIFFLNHNIFDKFIFQQYNHNVCTVRSEDLKFPHQ